MAATVVGILQSVATRAVTTVFFDISQTTNLVVSGTTWDTISSEGYLFKVTRDKLFTGGIGLTNPVGRYIRIPWPEGMEAQAVTTGPVLSSARIELTREDRLPFAIESFTAQLLANTAGAGGAWEIMPMLNGEDGVSDPFTYDATGIAGNRFTYNTPELSGYDAYKMTLYVDFALVSLTVVDASLPPPVLNLVRVDAATIQLSWPASAVGYGLESATNISAVGWSSVTNQVNTIGDVNSVLLAITDSSGFFRLRR
ncbi:MAG TPA: hypothetical protein DCE44_18820 [Verrucomicrobiales bacterium]|nr:hypothetical protein [Verrucomicrobiales bacterium]